MNDHGLLENHPGRLKGELFSECAGWIWEQLQEEEGILVAGELIELVLATERELNVHTDSLDRIATVLDDEFRVRGLSDNAAAIDRATIRLILEWEEDFLGFAGIPRSES